MNNYNPKNFYTYFKECYKLDYKEFSIDNILSTKYTFKWFVENNEELLHEDLPIIPYNNKKVEDLKKEIEIYKLEKKLFYASFFILGKNDNQLVKDKRFCAPLLLHTAEIKTINEETFLSIDRSKFTINRTVLTKFEEKNDKYTKDDFIAEISNMLYDETCSFINLKGLIDQHFSNVEAEELLLFPSVWSINKIRKHFTTTTYEDNAYSIVPAAGTVFVQKSESSLRVISDLNEMSKKSIFNTSLEELLFAKTSLKNFSTSIYKTRLNTEQYHALQNAQKFKNSVIVGPPGTGKTYTITSIISDAVIRNQSVLVVSKTKQAVEVLRHMLQDDFKLKDYLIHTTGNRYKSSLKSKIKRYLSGITSRETIEHSDSYIFSLFKQLSNLEQDFKKNVNRELKLSDLEFSGDLNWLEKWNLFYLKNWPHRDDDLWKIFDEIERKLEALEKEIQSFSKKKIQNNIKANSKHYRLDLAMFKGALEASSFTKYKKILQKVNHQNILKVFPIWLANLSDLNSILPLEKDLFDLVIIDEATQCDIASALPAIYRAKHAVIVGDPNQLRHYSFVSTAQQNQLKHKLQIPDDVIFDYRNKSILDLFISKVEGQDQVSFLREHFRSTPSIIEFSNTQFYYGQLEVLKSTPKHTSNNQIELIEVDGIRNKKGINAIEAECVISKVNQLIIKHKDDSYKPSIGILSPFNAQVSYIQKLLKDKYELETLKAFNILCGTPYNFQGSEREIIIISFCVCDDTHPSAFIHASKPEVLNVAITRAKSFQYVYKSVSDSKLNSDSLLYQYFSFVRTFSHLNNTDILHDEFQNEVVSTLKEMGYEDIRTGYPVAGNLLDILVCHKNHNYFIDLIGYPGMFKEAFALERYKTLARTGIRSLPLHYSLWKKNKKVVIERFKNFIE